MTKRSLLTAIATIALGFTPAVFGQNTSALNVTVGPEATFVAAFSATALTNVGTNFAGYSGTTNFTYKIRTSLTGGTGAITVEVTSFGTSGPAVADLAYTCTAATPGTACSASTSASTTVATNVVSFATDAHSTDAGDAGTAAWTLVDRTTVPSGAYTSTATFTISAT